MTSPFCIQKLSASLSITNPHSRKIFSHDDTRAFVKSLSQPCFFHPFRFLYIFCAVSVKPSPCAVLLSQYSCHVNEALRGESIFLLVGFLGWMVRSRVVQSGWIHDEETLVTRVQKVKGKAGSSQRKWKGGGRETLQPRTIQIFPHAFLKQP